MSKYLRYYGEFLSVDCHENRVAIYQESDTPFVPEEIQFPADSPLLIEWNESNKYDVMLGSSCTVKMFCPEDRKFLDAFYQIKYGDCRVDIFRDGEFYWTGCLDTECYEEPYESTDGYVVTTYWSDLSYLSRAKFDMGVGFKKVTAILSAALYKTQCIRTLHYSDFDESFEYNLHFTPMTLFGDMPTSTMFIHNLKYVGILTYLYVRTDNFCDETGEWDTWEEVLIAILQPLGIRLTQIGGFFYLYDINGLYNADNDLTNHNIYWTSDSQNLAIDSTYNNIKITWSPYAQESDLLPKGVWHDDVPTPKNLTSLGLLDGRNYEGSDYYSYVLKVDGITQVTSYDNYATGFTLWNSGYPKNITLGTGSVFKIVPKYDGSDDDGIAAYFQSFKATPFTNPANYATFISWSGKGHGKNPIAKTDSLNRSSILFTSAKTIVPPYSDSIQLRLTMESFLDVRINPFEEPAGRIGSTIKNYYDIATAMQIMNAHANFLYIPVLIHFKPTGTNKDYVYTNYHLLNQSAKVTTFPDSDGRWVEHDGTHHAWLAYYRPEVNDRQTSTALCQWVANRQTINNHNKELATALKKCEDGLYFDLPLINNTPTSGEIWVEVIDNGWIVCNGGDKFWNSEHLKWSKTIYNTLTFCLLKSPQLEIISSDIIDTEINTEDVVYNAEVNADAKDELSIDTKLGSYNDGVPTARGCYFNSNGTQINKVYRNINGVNKSGTIEQHLCGSLFSQYHDKHIVLSGECRLDAKRYLSFTEDNQSGKKFMCVSESQDLRADTMDAKFVEISADEYIKR